MTIKALLIIAALGGSGEYRVEMNTMDVRIVMEMECQMI